jgi:hypothetical protein
VRWDRLFEDLEAQLEVAEREEFAAEVTDRSRRELALVHLTDRFRGALGTPIELTVDGAGTVAGVLRRVGVDWLLLDVGTHPAALITSAAVLAVRGLPGGVVEASTVGAVEVRLDLAHVLRVITRDRAPVALSLRDGTQCTGTLDRVGADFVDLAEHPAGEPRRAGQVSAVRTVTFAGIAAVRPG